LRIIQTLRRDEAALRSGARYGRNVNFPSRHRWVTAKPEIEVGLVAAAASVGRIIYLQEIAKEIVMATKQLQSVFTAFPDGGRSESSLVRRLVGAKDDPAKQRIRAWLCDIDDERLRRFGLSAEDIAMLRGPSHRKPARRFRII
jgi:hypothetical protein